MNWNDLIELWLKTYASRDRSLQTIELRRYHLRRLVAEMAGRSLWDLTQQDLTDWIDGHGWSANTRLAMRSSIRSFYRWARWQGNIMADPTEEIPKPHTPQPRPRPVPNEIYSALITQHAVGSRLRVAIRLSGELGLRRSEVSRVARDDFFHDEEGWWLRVLGKGDKERILPCPEDLVREAAQLCNSTPGPFVFPSIPGGGAKEYGDTHISPHWIGSLISRTLPAGYTMHKLRHRAGTEVYLRSGHDIYLASKLLGHSSVVTTQAYVKVDMSRLRAAVGRAS